MSNCFISKMSGLVQCNTCLAVVFRSTLWSLGCCPVCMHLSTLYGEISRLQSLVCYLQSKEAYLSQLECEVKQPCNPPPQPQRPMKRRAVWKTVGSGRLRVVEQKHNTVGISVCNPFGVLSELESEISEDKSTDTQVRDVVSPKGENCNKQSGTEKGLKKKRKHLLVGDSIVRGVALGQNEDGLKEVRCLPGATASRDKRRISNIVKAATKETEVDLIIHLGTNDLSQKSVEEVKMEFQSLSLELSRMTDSITFSEILPDRSDNSKRLRILEFNGWLRQWCKEEGFGFVSHSVRRWSCKEMFKRDGLHPSHRGTEVLGEEFRCFLERHLN